MLRACGFRSARATLAAVPARPAGSFWLPRATRVDRVARPRSFERQKSTEKAARASPRRDFRRFWVDLGADFRVFRGCYARATRLAARRAEPLFLLTGAALSRVRRLCRKNKNRRNSRKNCSDNTSRTHSAEKTRFFRFRTRLGVDFGLLGMLPGAPGRPFWRPGGPLATLRTLSRRAGDAPETLPRRSRDAFGTLLDATGCPERVPGPIFSRVWVPRGVSRDRFSIDFQ